MERLATIDAANERSTAHFFFFFQKACTYEKTIPKVHTCNSRSESEKKLRGRGGEERREQVAVGERELRYPWLRAEAGMRR